jgi:hypothetical protein
MTQKGKHNRKKVLFAHFFCETGELNGSLSGFARFTLLLTDYGKHSIFGANRPDLPHGINADLKMQMTSCPN